MQIARYRLVAVLVVLVILLPLIFLLLRGKEEIKQKDVRSFLKPSENKLKITAIYPSNLYDLSGSEAAGQSNLMNLFDEDCDPKNNRPGTPVTDPLPIYHEEIYFPPGKGFRIVIDLGIQYALTDIYLYDKANQQDSVWVYSGEMNHWKQEVAYRTGYNSSSWGWKNFLTHTHTRYLMIEFKSPAAVISEMVLYGNAQEKIPLPFSYQYNKFPFSDKTLKEFMGTNSYDLPPVELMNPFGKVRLYQLMSWYDRDTINPYPANKLTLNYFNAGEEGQLKNYVKRIKQTSGNSLWVSLRGLPVYLQQKGWKDTDKPVTLPGMDTEDPLSYARHAKTFWNLAALFGHTNIDTNKIDVTDVRKFSGAAVMDLYENGNEEDAYWTGTYWSPMEYFAMSSADYDGHEKKLGNQTGLKNADPLSRLMMSGMIQLDTSRVKVLNFLCQQERKDKKFIWEGGVQYHHYSKEFHGNNSTSAITPEKDLLRMKLSKVRAFQHNLIPGVPAILGENGYDRNEGSSQHAPLLQGFTTEESQGILVIRSMVAAFMSGFDGYNQYMVRDATDNEEATGTFATSGLISGPSKNKRFAGWYFWSTVVNRLGNYLPDGIVTEKGPVWIYKFRGKTAKDSICYYMVSPTSDGTVVKNFRLTNKRLPIKNYEVLQLRNHSVNGEITSEASADGGIKIDVGESPVFILLKEK